ncbi:MAG: 30S ribosome-binding factor RbfA [Tepidanaerobacteraceae bacterium]|nr:30S ribosome-binding factor RbfA [Thermoanaerobacterales bacterium]
MDFSRSERVAEEIKKNVSYIINNNLKDPRINGLISVTGVTVTRDLRNAKIFLSLYGDKTKQNDVFEAIKNAKGFIRRELASMVRMRYIPELSFKLDDSIEYGIQINKLLDKVKNQQRENEGN